MLFLRLGLSLEIFNLDASPLDVFDRTCSVNNSLSCFLRVLQLIQSLLKKVRVGEQAQRRIDSTTRHIMCKAHATAPD